MGKGCITERVTYFARLSKLPTYLLKTIFLFVFSVLIQSGEDVTLEFQTVRYFCSIFRLYVMTAITDMLHLSESVFITYTFLLMAIRFFVVGLLSQQE